MQLDSAQPTPPCSHWHLALRWWYRDVVIRTRPALVDLRDVIRPGRFRSTGSMAASEARTSRPESQRAGTSPPRFSFNLFWMARYGWSSTIPPDRSVRAMAFAPSNEMDHVPGSGTGRELVSLNICSRIFGVDEGPRVLGHYWVLRKHQKTFKPPLAPLPFISALKCALKCGFLLGTARGRGSRAVRNRQNSPAAASHRRPGAGTSCQHHLVMRFHSPKAVTAPARLPFRKV